MTNYVILDMMYNSTYIMGSLIGSYFNIYDWNKRIHDLTDPVCGDLYHYIVYRKRGSE